MTAATLGDMLDYFQRTVYIFVPNICNAKCKFCYVTPAFKESATLPTKLISKTGKLFAAFSDLGFEEVRFTGGEPLLFRNFLDLATAAHAVDLKFSVYTNGLNLNLITGKYGLMPSRVVTSVHSYEDAGEVFGVPYSAAKVRQSTRRLARLGVAITLTAVYSRERENGIRALINDAHTWGAEDLKIIFPNVSRVPPDEIIAFRRFSRLVSSEQHKIRVRFTDFTYTRCELSSRGRLSIALPTMDAYACCVQVGEPPFDRIRSMDSTAVLDMCSRIWMDRLHDSGLKCISHLESCPIKLLHLNLGPSNGF